MHSFSGIVVRRLLLIALSAPLLAQVSSGQSTVRHVKVLDSKDAVEIEVESSDRIVPQTRVLTGPDRLVVDFPNAVPGNQLRSQSVNRGAVKDVRVGLFQAKPPITRMVLDLKTAQSYQVFPYGRTVIIKITGSIGNTSAGLDGSPHPGLTAASYTTGTEPAHDDPPAKPALEVTFHDGLLTINADKATLSDVLLAVQQRTGAEVTIAAGAEQEKVVASLGPGPAPEVLAQLLNGSKFNFLILSAENDPRQLDRVILSPRSDGGAAPLPPMAQPEAGGQEPGPAAPVQAQPGDTPRPPHDVNPRPRLPEVPPPNGDEPPEQ
ncbi:MAG: AMIN domain-containing protein [Candidatus Sulfotelmatobacter sp.]